jgi:hypothetical protein
MFDSAFWIDLCFNMAAGMRLTQTCQQKISKCGESNLDLLCILLGIVWLRANRWLAYFLLFGCAVN